MRLFTSKCHLETAWALLDHLQLCSNETQLYKKYFLNFISVKLVGIIISLLKSAFLKSSVSVFSGLPDTCKGLQCLICQKKQKPFCLLLQRCPQADVAGKLNSCGPLLARSANLLRRANHNLSRFAPNPFSKGCWCNSNTTGILLA